MNESQIPNSRDTQSNAEKSAELINFEKIKSPDELLSFMKDNIKYGFVGKEDGEIYSPEHEGWRKGDPPEKRLQDPKEVLDSGYGTCWEQVELERHWFEKQKYEFKTFLFMFGKDVSEERPAHTILAYKKDDKWYWFEHAFGSQIGIHKYDNLDELIEDVKKKLIDSALDAKATKADIEKYKLYEYETLIGDCESSEEFLNNIENNDLLLNNENKAELDNQIIKRVFHTQDDEQIKFLLERINKKIQNENKTFVSKKELESYVNDIFERLHDEDYLMRIFEVGDDEKIKEYADYVGLSEEKTDLMEHFAKLRRDTVDEMQIVLAQRKIDSPEKTEKEETIGVFEEQIEPHVREVVYEFNKKGLKTVYSGFWGMEHQSVGFKDDYLKDFEFAKDFLDQMKNKGIVIELESNMISFEVKEKFSLDELKSIWDEIGREMLENINH